MKSNQVLASTILAAVSLLAFAPSARAADERATLSVEPPREQEPPKVRHLSIELNPLATLIGRYGVQAELLPAAHHAFVLNPHFSYVVANEIDTAPSGDTVPKHRETYGGFGGEVGYRFYTGSRGPNGFFIGPSFIAGTYKSTSEAAGASDKSFTSFGGALDVGGQAVIGPGFLIGAGAGLQYTTVSEHYENLPLVAGVIAGGGFRPRLLFSLGWAFL